MLGVLYLLLCFLTGYVVCTLVLPELEGLSKLTFRSHRLTVSKVFVLVPAYFVVGTLLLTWTAYFAGYFFKDNDVPLKPANLITFSLFIAFCAIGLFVIFKKKSYPRLDGSHKRITKGEMVFFILSAILIYTLMWDTLYVSHNHLYVGYSVFGDFSPHLGMIRSFSVGNNFPTQYLHFAGEDIRYHFMFEFLVGNLEFLGMRIDLAFNIPSFFSMLSTMSLLYVLAVKLSGRRSVGILTLVFFLFRSSNSLFKYISELPEGTNAFLALFKNTEFIGYTPNESWGLWNLNVYCNQRHLCFGLCALLLAILLFLPYLYEAEKRIVSFVDAKEKALGSVITGFSRVKLILSSSLLKRDGWSVKNVRLAVFAGLLLGSIAFFNGAVLIAALAILFFIAIASDNRLDFVIVAGLSLVLSFAQSAFFIDGSALSPSFYFGFISKQRNFFGVLSYISALLGILPIILVAFFVISKKLRRYIFVCFSAPFILAFTISLTPDIAVNHKYIMISVMLLNIFAAIFICNMFRNKGFWTKLLCVILVFMMTATGAYDYTTVLRRNNSSVNFSFDLDNDLTKWVKNNTTSKDVFLTSMYSINNVVLGGGMLYLGWPYYAWSAGYDTDSRYAKAQQMFAAEDPVELKRLLLDEGIDYVIIDNDIRTTPEYYLNEAIFAENFEVVYESGSDEWKTTIYRVTKGQ